VATIEITTNDWPLIEPNGQRVAVEVEGAALGNYIVVEIANTLKSPQNPTERTKVKPISCG
jgi:hypothetical protein